MDLTTVTELVPARDRAALGRWQPGDTWLAGGSWLFSEPQPDVRRLIDLTTLGWPALTVTADALDLAATCTIAELSAAAGNLPPEWTAAGLITQCCEALLGSFKVWNVATVGGNICLALPAAPMISLASALDGTGTVWSPDGSQRRVPIAELVTGVRRTALQPGEVLRSVRLPAAALTGVTAFRQVSLTTLGRSGVLVIGRLAPANGSTLFTVTAATTRPVRLSFPGVPSVEALLAALDAAGPVYHDDVHGHPQWRADLTRVGLAEVRDELASRQP